MGEGGVWFGLIWFDLVRCGVVWCAMVCYVQVMHVGDKEREGKGGEKVGMLEAPSLPNSPHPPTQTTL